jgi:hypothetical protein
MAEKVKAKVYMVGSTSAIEVEIKDKDSFLKELKDLSAANEFYIHRDEDGEVAINVSLIQAVEFPNDKDSKRGAGLVS